MDSMYKKRPGTSGINGQLYETKLLSLFLFRLLHKDNVEEFHMACNMGDIGAYDDICLKIKITGQDRPLVLFIQVKHKDNDERCLTLDGTSDFVKWCNSILKVKQKFNSNKSQDKIFSGKFEENDCLFILYTNARYDLNENDTFVSNVSTDLNDLVATSEAVGCNVAYTDNDVEEFGERILKEEIVILAERFIRFLNDKSRSMNIMNDEYILRYHVVLAQQVLAVSDIQSDDVKSDLKWRCLKFRPDFFFSEDKNLQLLQKEMLEEILKIHAKCGRSGKGNNNINDIVTLEIETEELIASFLSNPSETTLSTLIEKRIVSYKNNKLEFITKRSESEKKQLQKILMTPTEIETAKAAAAKSILLSLQIKVPVSFGNVDVVVKGNAKKMDNRLNHLINTFIDLCETAKRVGNYEIITIDETIDERFLSLKCGVGSIIVKDEHTKLLKFSESYLPSQNQAKKLYLKLKNTITNLHEYRFDVKTIKFPKLSLDGTDVAKEFLSKLVIYAKQKNHYEVEEILKEEIKKQQCHYKDINSDSMFLYLHNEIQKWWMSPKAAPYITKTCNIYQKAKADFLKEPQISVLQSMYYVSKIKSIEYTFNQTAIQSLDLTLNDIIVTKITKLTTLKIKQYLEFKSKNYAILDLECIINLTKQNFDILIQEVKNTEKVLIIICDNSKSGRLLYKRLDELAQAIEDKNKIIVTGHKLLDIVKEYFISLQVRDEENQSFSELSWQSQKNILKNTPILFQGEKMTLEWFVDDTSDKYIQGYVLNKIISNEPIKIGDSLLDSNYEEIKHLYIDRKVRETSFDLDEVSSEKEYKSYDYFLLNTIYDINDDIVLITAKPGMGKSTLLTHLSLETKKIDKKLWIVRINLLDHSKEFYKWHEKKIDTLETLSFICKVILKNNNIPIVLKETQGKVYLDCEIDNEESNFELNMFLHCYNNGNVVFLFDGFDEICPHYKDCVLKFFEVVRNYSQRNRTWVTSRPYSELLPDLERVLGKSYELEYFHADDQERYLKNFWQAKLNFDTLNYTQLKNILSFIDFMRDIMLTTDAAEVLHYRFRKIFYLFYEFLNSHFPHIDMIFTKLPLFGDQFEQITIESLEKDYDESDTESNATEKESRCSNNTVADSLHLDQLFGETLIIETEYLAPCKKSQRIDKLMGTPLLLHLVANYFINVISEKKSNEWKLGINILYIYEMFIESKLKKILFENKNKMDIYNPEIMLMYAKQRMECLATHKKLAAYALLYPIFDGIYLKEFQDMKPFKQDDLTEFEHILETIRNGTEKTGLISHVTFDNTPIFIHRTFAEYFATEYICDIFKSDKFGFACKNLLFTTINIWWRGTFDMLPWIHKKREIDIELDRIISEIEDKRPIVLWYRNLFCRENWTMEQFVRLMSSSQEDYEDGCLSCYNNEYIDNMINGYQERDLHILKIKEDIIGLMKPHLKTYFTPYPADEL